MDGQKLPDPARASSIKGKVRGAITPFDYPGKIGPCGQWIAHCPADGCQGAELVDIADLAFMCLSCFNRDNDNLWYAVQLPKKRARIERLLLNRPAKNRHWTAETVKQLEAENKEHGVEV